MMEEKDSLLVEWEIAAQAMGKEMSEMKAAGYNKNVSMTAIRVTGALGETVTIGYKLSAFNGTTTIERMVFFPHDKLG